MSKKINVTVYNEFVHEREEARIAKVYPEGIHTVICNKLSEKGNYNLQCATFDMPEHGLSQQVLDNTDVLIYWAHCKHDAFSDEVALRIQQRVLEGMGFIVLHSGHYSKAFKLLMGTSCRVKWRENDERERLWVVEPSHPIARYIPEYIEFEQEETYGERFEIPAPDELVFLSWFQGGEVCRSGCCYKRGLGKIFYFRPGHEEYPTYYRDDVAQILHNAVQWSYSEGVTKPSLGHFEALENVHDKFEGMDEALKKHEYIK